MLNSIRDCFVTGKWDDNQDAATLLKEDGKRGEPVLVKLTLLKKLRLMVEKKCCVLDNSV